MPESSGRRESAAFWGTLPLLSATMLLFLGAFAMFTFAPHAGAGRFPLWSLLFTLGIVAAIGSTFSWFYASDEPDDSESPLDAALSPAGRRPDFGRPVPEVGPRPSATVEGAVGASGTKPWDEDVLPPAVAHGPRPILTTLDDPGEIGRALEEIAEIQRQLAARTTNSPRAAAASARS
jgi:hypothetical protein